jgi:hypothetical protein
MKDLFGRAILDYQLQPSPLYLVTETSISEEDRMEVAYLFRDFDAMPEMEQKALQLATGNVLDVGCGAGSHSLYLQNERKLNVTSIDISKNAIEACQLRGLRNAIVQNVMEMQPKQPFDTILLLMNGAGMCGKIKNLLPFLLKLKSLISDDGQILLDSSDISYMFDKEDDGGVWIPANVDYYGEVQFKIAYKGKKEHPFDWLYVDFETLKKAAALASLSCELIVEGPHFDYLAKLQNF